MTAYLALFAWSFLAATVLPLASEPMLVALVRTRDEMMVPVLVATAGNYLGACTTYFIARAAARRVAVVAEAVKGHGRAVALIERFGQPALLLSWVPIIGDALCIASGWLRQNVLAATGFMAVGKLARYIVVAYAAHAFAG